MSDTTTKTDARRPWHGTDNPFEALYQWVSTEIGHAGSSPEVVALRADVASLRQQLGALEQRLVTALKPPAPPVPATPIVLPPKPAA